MQHIQPHLCCLILDYTIKNRYTDILYNDIGNIFLLTSLYSESEVLNLGRELEEGNKSRRTSRGTYNNIGRMTHIYML